MKRYKFRPLASVTVGDRKADPELGEVAEFEAIVSVFGNVDEVGDRVVKGAFANTLADWAEKAKADPPQYLPIWYSHGYGDVANLIGRAVEAKELDEGLWIKGVLFVERKTKAVDVYGDFKDGVLSQFSFAYDVVEEKRQNGANELLELVLHEAGPTPIGANRETRLLAVKNDDGAYALVDDKAWVGVAGSYEARGRQLSQAVSAYFGDGGYAYVEASFDDRVVATIEDGDGAKTFEFPYAVDEDGAVALGDPVEVEIVGRIEPKDRLAAVKNGRVPVDEPPNGDEGKAAGRDNVDVRGALLAAQLKHELSQIA